MSFTKAARDARRGIKRREREQVLSNRGWVESLATPRILQEAKIDYESAGGKVYAPVWVYGVVDRAGTSSLTSVLILLMSTRDDERDQKLLCGELIMDTGVPPSVRTAAAGFIGALQEKERKREDGTTKRSHASPASQAGQGLCA